MELTVNGEPRTVPDGTTAAQLLETLEIHPERVVVELNLKILRRAELAGAVLQPNDRVEIVRFVGGGSCEERSRLEARGSRERPRQLVVATSHEPQATSALSI